MAFPVQTSPSSFLSVPISSIPLLSPILYLLPWILSLYQLRILPLSHIPIVLLPNLPAYSPSIHLLILLAHMITPTKFAPLPLLPSSSSWYIIYMLSQILRPFMRSYQTLVALPLLCLLLLLLLPFSFAMLRVEPAVLQVASVVVELKAQNWLSCVDSWCKVVVVVVVMLVMLVIVIWRSRCENQ